MLIAGGIMDHVRTRWPEWMLSVTLLLQASTITFGESLHNNSLYVVIRSLLNVRTAAAGAIIVAAIWIGALVLNGTFLRFRRISPWVRVLAGTAAAGYWTLWAVTTFKSVDYTSVAWVNYASQAVMAGMCVVMAAGEVAHADKKAGQWRRIQQQRTGSL